MNSNWTNKWHNVVVIVDFVKTKAFPLRIFSPSNAPVRTWNINNFIFQCQRAHEICRHPDVHFQVVQLAIGFYPSKIDWKIECNCCGGRRFNGCQRSVPFAWLETHYQLDGLGHLRISMSRTNHKDTVNRPHFISQSSKLHLSWISRESNVGWTQSPWLKYAIYDTNGTMDYLLHIWCSATSDART